MVVVVEVVEEEVVAGGAVAVVEVGGGEVVVVGESGELVVGAVDASELEGVVDEQAAMTKTRPTIALRRAIYGRVSL